MSSSEDRHSNITPFPEEQSLRAQACAWIARLDSDNLDEADLARLRAWINADPAHGEEIRQQAALWGELDILTRLQLPRPARSRPRVRSALRWAAAPLILALAATLYFARDIQPGQPAPDPDVHMAARGDQQSVVLPDGSQMHLNTQSYARTEYTADERGVVLLAGEAYFDVAPDVDRPFVVQAGSQRIRAVGTAFSVRLRPRNLEVIVTEGTVEVAATPSASTSAGTRLEPVAVRAGQMIVVEQDARALQAVSAEELSRKLLWRERMLAFSDDTLAEVVAEFNRYSATSLVITDAELAAMRIGGNFRVDDQQALLEALEESFGVQVVRAGEDLVLLSLEKP